MICLGPKIEFSRGCAIAFVLALEVKETVGAGDAFMAGLTRGIDHQRVLEITCRLGAYVASHYGATPLLPPELTQPLR